MRISDWSSDVCSSDLAGHFVDCITAIREFSPGTKIEILTPDFRGKGRMERALEILAANPPDVFNHNVETVPDLYRNVRPGADYQWSMTLLQKFKARHPHIPTKSGVMLGLGETMEQVQATLRDLRSEEHTSALQSLMRISYA